MGTPIGTFPPNATRMEPADIAGVGNNTDESPADSHDIPVSALRRSNADHDIESIQEDVNLISTLKDVNIRAKIKIQNFINGVLKGGVDNAGVTHADKIRVDTNLDMTGAEMISDIDQGGFELINSKTIPEMQSGKGLHFNGVDQSVTIASDTAIADIFSNGGAYICNFNAGTAGGSNASRFFDKVNVRLAFNSSGGQLNFLQIMSGDNGSWLSDTNVEFNKDSIIAVSYDSSSTSNNPSIYIEGVEIQLTESTAPTGTALSDASEVLYLGNRVTSNTPFDGEIRSALFLNRELTADELKSWSNNPLKQLEFKDIGGSQVALTSGTLEIGKQYRIDNYISSDDFTNVGAASNATGIVFTATGETPTTWTNSSELIKEGCIAEWRPDTIKSESDTWYDKQNGNNGIIDAGYVNDDLVSIDNVVEAIGTFTPSHKAIIKIDGVNYKIQLDQV